MNKEGYRDPTAEQAVHNVDKSNHKPWREVTDAERNKNKKEKCRFCEYANRLTKENDYSVLTCDYIGITGHSRGCSPIECDKFKPRTKGRRRKRLI